MAYQEACGGVGRGEVVMQIGMGGGMKVGAVPDWGQGWAGEGAAWGMYPVLRRADGDSC
jgi:hypothetical protein